MSSTSSPGIQLLAALQELEQQANLATLSTSLLRQCLAVARQAKQASQACDQFTALALIRLESLALQSQQTLRRLIITQLLCQRMSVNDSVAQSLLCATLCHSVIQDNQKYQLLLRWLKQCNQPLWYSGALMLHNLLPHAGKQGFYRALHRLSTTQRLLVFATLLADKMLEKHFDEAIQAVAQKLPPTFLPLMDGLYPFPGGIPPGSHIELADQRLAMVLSVSDAGVIVRGVPDSDNGLGQSVEWISYDNVNAIHPRLCFPDVSVFESCWNSDWQQACEISPTLSAQSKSTYPISQPPAKLLVIQDLLGHPDSDLDNLARHIADEGFLARQLSEDASRRTRLKLRMSEVKHALLFQGLERTRHLLIQQALISRLNQHFFPLQESLLQFTQLVVRIMEALAHQHASLDSDEAMTLGYFACAGLFTHPAIKLMVKLPKPATPAYALSGLIPQSADMQIHALKLAEGWHQQHKLLQALKYHADMPHDMPVGIRASACLLGLSLMIARHIWFAETLDDNCPYHLAAINLLDINTAQCQMVKWQAIEQSHCYCPLSG
ncbi:HDOD domain-containing protein [Bowmanella denitrificans]|uniref:HDOD domain-containing protein n=1 Tax=Bowmanella denitrificans TaxID=366582 RepID=UPI000C9B8EDB|nr:HDOD domain-containing protein [Bowmanella denitrificans]